MPNKQSTGALKERDQSTGASRSKRRNKCVFSRCPRQQDVQGEQLCQECIDKLQAKQSADGDTGNEKQLPVGSPGHVTLIQQAPQHPPRDNNHDDEYEHHDIEMYRRQGAIPRHVRRPKPASPPRDAECDAMFDVVQPPKADAPLVVHSSRRRRRGDEDDDVNYELRVPDYVTEDQIQHNRRHKKRSAEESRQNTLNWLDSDESHRHSDEALPRDEHLAEGPSSSLQQVSGVTTSLWLDDDDE